MRDQDQVEICKVGPWGKCIGMRIPKALLKKYGIKRYVLIREREDGFYVEPFSPPGGVGHD